MNKVTLIKSQLKERCEGDVMVRKNRSYRGLEQDGIQTYDVFYSLPTPKEKEIINKIISEHVEISYGHIVVGGQYGYKTMFQIKE